MNVVVETLHTALKITHATTYKSTTNDTTSQNVQNGFNDDDDDDRGNENIDDGIVRRCF